MFFPVRNALIYALVSAITGFATGFAKANVLDEMPNTQACRTLKNDIMPHVESRQNRDDLDFLMVGTYRQGKDGEQCRIFKGDRDRIKNSRDLNLSGISLYARERVFAWGRSCLLDWCDACSGYSAISSSFLYAAGTELNLVPWIVPEHLDDSPHLTSYGRQKKWYSD